MWPQALSIGFGFGFDADAQLGTAPGPFRLISEPMNFQLPYGLQFDLDKSEYLFVPSLSKPFASLGTTDSNVKKSEQDARNPPTAHVLSAPLTHAFAANAKPPPPPRGLWPCWR